MQNKYGISSIVVTLQTAASFLVNISYFDLSTF